MKIGLIAAAGLCLAASTAMAAPLTPEQALARARSEAPMKVKGGAAAPKLVHTAMQKSGQAALYVFDTANGYMVLSADDIAVPVLGYADNDATFDAADMAPAMQWWLTEYAGEIEYALTHADNDAKAGIGYSTAVAASRAGRHAVAPLCETNWDQGTPYNDQCPTYGNKRTFTGCVATAMAQVMKHFNYPEKGQGSISYTCSNLSKNLSMDFSTQAFDWDNMLRNYKTGQYNQTEANAVAYLMKACGYAVQMNYGIDASGTISMYIADAMYKYFNYDGNIRYFMRMMYSPAEWENMVYENIANVGPIIYNGSSTIGGGHSFVCDGYDGEGYFHFNWGWSGTSNGYFALTALNPDNLGTGGGGGGGFNFSQDAIFGIQPPKAGQDVVLQPEQVTQMGSLTASVSGSRLIFNLKDYGQMWCNYTCNTMRFQFGVKFVKENATAADAPIYATASTRTWELKPGYGAAASSVQPTVTLTTAAIPDGTYRASIVWRSTTGTDTQWKDTQCPYGAITYVRFTKNGTSYTVDTPAQNLLKITSYKISDPLYFGCLCNVEVTVTNPGDTEISSGFAPVLYSGSTLSFMGESVMLTVQPGQTVTKQWTTALTPLVNIFQFTSPKTYNLSFYDEESYHTYTDDVNAKVTMQPTPAAPTVRLKGIPTITGAKRSGLANVVYTVTDPTAMEVNANINLTAGYFSYNVMACLCTGNSDGSMDIRAYTTVPMTIEAGNVAPFQGTLSFPTAEVGDEYIFVFTYSTATSIEIIPTTYNMTVKIAESGIEDLTTNDALTLSYDKASATVTAHSGSAIATIEAYNAAGALVAAVKGADTLPLADTANGMLIIKAIDADGAVATLKVVR